MTWFGRAVTTDLIITSFPPLVKNLKVQPLTLLFKRSCTKPNTLTVLWSANYTDLSVVTILFFFNRRYIYEDLIEKF